LVATSVFAAAVPASAQEGNDVKKRNDIKVMLGLIGAGELGLQLMDQMIVSFKEEMPDVPDKFWKEFRAEVDADQLTNLAVPIYAKYFNHDDIKQLIKFYKSPIGKKLVKYQPQVMAETTEVAQKWGEDLGRKIAEKLEKEGYE